MKNKQVRSTMILAILAFSCGCGPRSHQPIDSEKGMRLLGNIPNTEPLPKKLEIYSDLKDGPRELSRRFSEKKGENSDLVFQTEDPDEIEAFITAMRNEGTSTIIDVSKRNGKSYHILLYDSESSSAFHYIVFLPKATHETPYIMVGSTSARYICSAFALKEWLSNNVEKALSKKP